MNRRNAVAIALVLALRRGRGARRGDAHDRTSARPRPGAEGVRPRRSRSRNAQLDRVEVALLRALRQRPPKLPPVPQGSADARRDSRIPAVPAAPAAVPVARRAGAPAVIYVRPAPIVHVVHRHGGEHETEHGGDHERAGGGDD